MPFRHRVKVRYGETDQMGVVHHASYLAYLEEARTEYLERLGRPYAELEREGIGLPVRRVELRFRAPARYGDELDVELSVGRLGAASVMFQYEVFRVPDGTPLTSARIELACVDLADPKRPPRALPDGLRGLLEGEGEAAPRDQA